MWGWVQVWPDHRGGVSEVVIWSDNEMPLKALMSTVELKPNLWLSLDSYSTSLREWKKLAAIFCEMRKHELAKMSAHDYEGRPLGICHMDM